MQHIDDKIVVVLLPILKWKPFPRYCITIMTKTGIIYLAVILKS